jgi:DNA helicase INO80
MSSRLSALLQLERRRANKPLERVASTAPPVSSQRNGEAGKKLEAGALQNPDLLSLLPSTSAGGDLTPATSRPSSPALTPMSDRLNATVFELDEQVPQLKKAKKVDEATMLKRVRALEETQKKVWTTIARRDIPKVSLLLVGTSQTCN